MAKIEKQILTLEGKKKYEDELSELINVKRPQVTQAIKEAKEQGDLSENADYDAARNEQAQVEARIAYLKQLLENAIIIDTNENSTTVQLGSTVTFEKGGKEITYTIVGPAEADPLQGKISNACNLGIALIGKQVGDITDVNAPKPYSIKILEIK